ncbi:hypothetical protein [Legionella cincinnatiensis]|uniref:RCC1 domain-containing protein n=1 Tax=Legionella cincinnatiensis TaxID=28085 RepID=UPI001040E4CE|nr:hypothetical protein [Legionella cincinnatiensis]
MRRKNYKGKPIGFWLSGVAGVVINSLAHASTPLWTYSAPSPASVTVSDGGIATVSYTVTNMSRRGKYLILKPTPGVSASACYLAGMRSICNLTLTINGSAIPQQGLHAGPVLCEQGNPNQCYQPALDKQLNVNRSSDGPGHLLLSQYGRPISALALRPGDTGTLLLTNTGQRSISSLSIQLPFGWSDYFTNNCLAVLAPSQNCTITYTVPSLSMTGILNPLTILGTGADNSITLPVSIQAIGSVSCWGYNGFGQLGNGTTGSSSIPVSVNGIGNALSITGGLFHTCALLNSGAVSCWGYNGVGQLGNGTLTNSSIPVSVNGIGNALAITAGDYHTCALLNSGAVSCWGSNGVGQLGNGTTTSSSTPVSVSGISNAVAISAGSNSTCALLDSGVINCWGYNGFGQLGNGTTTNSSIPVSVNGISNALAITEGGNHICALLNSGAVSCWGYNVSGQLGNGSTTTSSTPVSVSGISNAVAISAGSNSTCALLDSGVINCWGYNGFGQLGNGTTASSSIPVSVNGISNALAITEGVNHTCALLNSGAVSCWGYNVSGQLGNGISGVGAYSSTPVQTCSESGCPNPLNALGIFNHNLGNQSCAIIPVP